MNIDDFLRDVEAFDREGAERWLPSSRLNGRYEVSNFGEVRNTKTKRKLAQQLNDKGYLIVRAYDGTTEDHREFRVHVLVLEAFRGPRPSGQVGRHGPKGKLCNHLTNLSYGTQQENAGADRNRDGTQSRGEYLPRGETHHKATMSEDTAREILKEYREAGNYTYGFANRVSQERGISYSAVYNLIRGKSWKHLSR